MSKSQLYVKLCILVAVVRCVMHLKGMNMESTCSLTDAEMSAMSSLLVSGDGRGWPCGMCPRPSAVALTGATKAHKSLTGRARTLGRFYEEL